MQANHITYVTSHVPSRLEDPQVRILDKIGHTFPLTHFLLPRSAFPARESSCAIKFTRLEGYFDLLEQVFSFFRGP
jgi:hypothetical protein